MRKCFINLLMPTMLICASGCAHVHTIVAVDAKDAGERIHTKYKYKIGYWFNTDGICRLDKDRWMVDKELMKSFARWQPDVFGENGMPVTSEMTPLGRVQSSSASAERKSCGYPVLPFLSILTYCVIPKVDTSHSHEQWAFQVTGDKGQKVSIDTCVHADCAWGIPPFRWLLCWWNTDTCYSKKRTYDSHAMNVGTDSFVDKEVVNRAMAYGLAVRLKELEDNGQIDDDMPISAIASAEMSKTLFGTSVEIVRCGNTTGRDFEYDFVLRSKGGGKLKLVDYERVRGAFRTAIINTYCMKHPEANPRSLVTYFTRYTMGGDCVKGRVAVLTIEVKTVFYDAAKREGRMSAKIGANQFEDARRFVRSLIEELATRSNIVIEGDSLPAGAIFYTGNERLSENGLLEVEFRTE